MDAPGSGDRMTDPHVFREVRALNGDKGYIVFRRDMPNGLFDKDQTYWQMGRIETKDDIREVTENWISGRIPHIGALGGSIAIDSSPECVVFVPYADAQPYLYTTNEWGDIFP